jgi:hypothetical protein
MLKFLVYSASFEPGALRSLENIFCRDLSLGVLGPSQLQLSAYATATELTSLGVLAAQQEVKCFVLS